MKRTFISAILAVALIMTAACGQNHQTAGSTPGDLHPSAGEPELSSSEAAPLQNTAPGCIEQAVQQALAKFVQPGMGEYEKAKAAFDYIIETTCILEPIGLDLWQIRGSYESPPSFVENRSLSVLLYGMGMCEDYAAALTMLLREMGLEAEYVPGLTYAANGGGLVDHAWVVAKIDGIWYHIDPQLEDNVSHHDTIRYKYFMRSDATMAGSHRWGQNLIESGLLTAEQSEELARDFPAPVCPKDYPTPSPHSFTPAPIPDTKTLKAEIEQEFLQYEEAHGPLEERELNIIPPVFGLEGFGPPD